MRRAALHFAHNPEQNRPDHVKTSTTRARLEKCHWVQVASERFARPSPAVCSGMFTHEMKDYREVAYNSLTAGNCHLVSRPIRPFNRVSLCKAEFGRFREMLLPLSHEMERGWPTFPTNVVPEPLPLPRYRGCRLVRVARPLNKPQELLVCRLRREQG